VTISREPYTPAANDTPTLQKKIPILQDRRTSTGQTVLIAGFSALLIFAVLASSIFDRWAIAILEIGSALLLLFSIWPQLTSGRLQLGASRLYAPVVLFGLIIAVQVAFGLSAYVHVTRLELWKYAGYGSLFLLANQFQPAGAHRLLTILAAFGFIVALFALVQDLASNGKIYWFWPAVSGRIFGPYANHSHYAGLMEMLAPIPLAMALTDCARRHQQMLWIIAGILMGATIFVCDSRGGMIAFAVEMVFLAGLFVARRSPRTAGALCAICLVIGAFVFWIDGGRVLEQVDSLRDPLTNADVGSRLTIARDSLRMVLDRPIAGWGLGLFPIIYPQYRSFSTDLLVNQAHNDYLQALVETGILGFVCVLWFIGNLYRSGMRNLNAHSRIATAPALGSLVGCTGILVHSLSDFNLHIPGNAALFFVLCGIASNGKALAAQNKATRAGFCNQSSCLVTFLANGCSFHRSCSPAGPDHEQVLASLLRLTTRARRSEVSSPIKQTMFNQASPADTAGNRFSLQQAQSCSDTWVPHHRGGKL
jgi:O-antigen ligase